MKNDNSLNVLREWIAAFCQAWEMLLDIPLPKRLEEIAESESAENGTRVLVMFPAIGAVLGIAAYLISWLLILFLHKPAASIISGIALAVGYEFLTSWRNVSIAASYVERKLEGASFAETIMELDDKFTTHRNAAGMIVIVSIFLIRAFCIGFLVYHGQLFWLITTMTFGFVAQAHLATMEELDSSGPIVELDDDRFLFMPWAAAAAIAFLTGISALAPVLVAFLFTFLIAYFSAKYMNEKLGGTTGMIVGIVGYKIEILTLILGLILLVRA
jgi:cobalamin synthase